jgi:hypothetical protein
MEISQEQYERIQDCLLAQCGNVRHENLVMLNAILYVPSRSRGRVRRSQ